MCLILRIPFLILKNQFINIIDELTQIMSNNDNGQDPENRRNTNFANKPVELGKEYTVQITEKSYKGDGVARVQGFVIFVKDGQVGNDVKVKITSIGNRFAKAELVTENTDS